MEYPIKKQKFNPSRSFDDRSLVKEKSSVSLERSKEIEKLIMPELMKELEILKKNDPVVKAVFDRN